MKKKIVNLKNIILCRVMFHSPILYDESIDYDFLKACGLDVNLPIFWFDGELSVDIISAFVQAKKCVKFNLILNATAVSYFNIKRFFDLDNLLVLDKKTASLKLLTELAKANINYYSGTNYKFEFLENFIKINEKTLNFSQKNYYFEDFGKISGVYYNAKQFLLDGKNTLVRVCNPCNESKDCIIKCNIILPKGYYKFRREKYFVEALNLQNFKRYVLNFSQKNCGCNFSCVEGLENSCYAKIYVEICLKLLPKVCKEILLNFGERILNIKNLNMLKLFECSQRVANEVFDFKICTNNCHLDLRMNRVLPQKIYASWLDGKVCADDENEYLEFRDGILKKEKNKIYLKKPPKLQLRCLKIFLFGEFKTINIYDGTEKSFVVGDIKMPFASCLSQKLFHKNKEICLCFGA